MFGGQFLADFPVSDLDVPVRNRLPVVADTIVNQMAMRVLPIQMPHQQKLCVPNTHALHVFFGDFRHFLVGELFRILRGDEVVAEAFSVWALMELGSQKLLRRDQFSYPFPGDEPLKLDLPLRFRVPHADEMTLAGQRSIVYSDIDYNGHMNNTRYPDMLCDFTPEICSRQVTGVVLSYLHEAALGKTLAVYRKDNGEEHLFRTMDEDGNTCLEARLLTEPLTGGN